MRYLSKVTFDFFGLVRVCGAAIAMRWLFAIFANCVTILKRKNLVPADLALGEGPFRVRSTRYGVDFRILGASAMSGIREMYVRDVYLGHGLLGISDGDVVVDLGANNGNFTNYALSFGKKVLVVAVEPHLGANSVFRKSVGLNAGYLERVTLIPAFVGLTSHTERFMKSSDPNYSQTRWITEEQLIREGNLTRVDFMKCDIEGGEFGLLNQDSKVLAMVRSLAIEVHAFAGDVNRFRNDLKALGFSIVAVSYGRHRRSGGPRARSIRSDQDGSVTILAERL